MLQWIPHPSNPSPLNSLPHLWNWSSSLWSEPSYLFYVLYYTTIDLPTVALDFVSKSIKGSRTLISYFKRIFPGSYVFGVSLLQVTQTLMHIGKIHHFSNLTALVSLGSGVKVRPELLSYFVHKALYDIVQKSKNNEHTLLSSFECSLKLFLTFRLPNSLRFLVQMTSFYWATFIYL